MINLQTSEINMLKRDNEDQYDNRFHPTLGLRLRVHFQTVRLLLYYAQMLKITFIGHTKPTLEALLIMSMRHRNKLHIWIPCEILSFLSINSTIFWDNDPKPPSRMTTNVLVPHHQCVQSVWPIHLDKVSSLFLCLVSFYVPRFACHPSLLWPPLTCHLRMCVDPLHRSIQHKNLAVHLLNTSRAHGAMVRHKLLI